MPSGCAEGLDVAEHGGAFTHLSHKCACRTVREKTSCAQPLVSPQVLVLKMEKEREDALSRVKALEAAAFEQQQVGEPERFLVDRKFGLEYVNSVWNTARGCRNWLVDRSLGRHTGWSG
eukprot:354865-Chlamydomonas_euryale.AAC.2